MAMFYSCSLRGKEVRKKKVNHNKLSNSWEFYFILFSNFDSAFEAVNGAGERNVWISSLLGGYIIMLTTQLTKASLIDWKHIQKLIQKTLGFSYTIFFHEWVKQQLKATAMSLSRRSLLDFGFDFFLCVSHISRN